MFPLREFLSKFVDNLYVYASDDYCYGYRDFGLDSKYVLYTIVKFGKSGYDTNLVYEKCTIGRYLKRAYNKLSPAEITHICEIYKAKLTDTANFKIISGDAIKDAYFRENYIPNHGTLSNSCMRYLKCQRKNFFKIYADNAKMLIMTPKRGKRIMGRAILWPYGDSYLMDRVYSTENFVQHQFYDYAKQNKFGILQRNSYVCDGEVQKWLLPEDNYTDAKHLNIKIKLLEPCRYYPFVDSFCYLDENESTLSTFPIKDGYILHSTEGFKIYR